MPFCRKGFVYSCPRCGHLVRRLRAKTSGRPYTVNVKPVGDGEFEFRRDDWHSPAVCWGIVNKESSE